jgi:hypothetical protein
MVCIGVWLGRVAYKYLNKLGSIFVIISLKKGTKYIFMNFSQIECCKNAFYVMMIYAHGVKWSIGQEVL